MSSQQNLYRSQSTVSTILKKLYSDGSYDDFLKFIQITSGNEFSYLLEVTQTLLSICNKVTLPFNAIDICGTGGDNSNIKTTNISTMSAFVLATMGIPVAKHGGKAVSSLSGSVDFLQALNISEIEPIHSIAKYGLCFLPAQHYHPSFKNIAPFRKQYGKRTIFNLLGPLLNPAMVSCQMVGVSFEHTNMVSYAKILHKLGRKSVAVVQSECGSDELLSFQKNKIVCITKEEVQLQELDLTPFNFHKLNLEDTENAIFGHSPQKNAENAMKFFENPQEGILQDTIALNCALAAVVFGKVASLKDSIDLARSVIASRKPIELIYSMQSLY